MIGASATVFVSRASSLRQREGTVQQRVAPEEHADVDLVLGHFHFKKEPKRLLYLLCVDVVVVQCHDAQLERTEQGQSTTRDPEDLCSLVVYPEPTLNFRRYYCLPNIPGFEWKEGWLGSASRSASRPDVE